jgi:hypothetical protein
MRSILLRFLRLFFLPTTRTSKNHTIDLELSPFAEFPCIIICFSFLTTRIVYNIVVNIDINETTERIPQPVSYTQTRTTILALANENPSRFLFLHCFY